jgi:hypothetical protein
MKAVVLPVIAIGFFGAVSASAQCDLGTETLFAQVVGDTVQIYDVRACLNCASEYVMSVERVGDTLIVMEVDTQPLIATCSCTYGLQTTIVGLPAGAYTAVVYRDIRVKFPGAELDLVGSVQFECGPSGAPEMSATGSQSGCHPQAVGEDRDEHPRQFALLPNYPNPFNPSTTIRYELPVSGLVRLSVLDLLGREVATLVDERQDPGRHEVTFDAGPLASGLYVYRLQAGHVSRTHTLMILK